MNTFEGDLIGTGLHIGIVVSRFNEFITSKLLTGAVDMLERHDVHDIDVAWVPGAFEIPAAAQRLAFTGRYDAIVCLGAVIRGATTHYDHICAEVSKGIAQVSLGMELPVIFGVVTTENIEQAVERSGTKSGNKGADAALSAIEMANLMRVIDDHDADLDDDDDDDNSGDNAGGEDMPF